MSAIEENTMSTTETDRIEIARRIDSARVVLRHGSGGGVDAEDAAALLAEVDRLRGAIEQHRQDYAHAIGQQTKDRGEMNRKKRDAAHRLWEAIGERGCLPPKPSRQQEVIALAQEHGRMAAAGVPGEVGPAVP